MVPINYLAVLLATVAAMLVGWLWYGPLFGAKWRALAGDPKPRAAVVYPIAFVANAATAYVLAYVTSASSTANGNGFFVPALLSALFLWLGFSAARALIVTLFEAASVKLFLINTGHNLVVALVMALVIAILGF